VLYTVVLHEIQIRSYRASAAAEVMAPFHHLDMLSTRE